MSRAREGVRRAIAAMPPWRESLVTMMIGSLSIGLGLAALAALMIPNPRPDPVYAACAGQWLGFGGLLLAHRNGRGPSPLSVLGTAICLVVVGPVYLFAALLLAGIVAWALLSVWVVRAVLRALGG